MLFVHLSQSMLRILKCGTLKLWDTERDIDGEMNTYADTSTQLMKLANMSIRFNFVFSLSANKFGVNSILELNNNDFDCTMTHDQ